MIFVRHALPGERVRAVVTQATSRFSRADAVQVLAASPDRVQPPCPHARPGGCGGCDWQHASLPAQREAKARVIRQQLTRLAGLDREVTVEELPGHPDGLGWRTTVGFTIGPDGVPGLLRHRSHEVVEVGSCPIAHPLVAATGVTRRRWPGARRADVAVVPGTGERSVTITGSVSGDLAAGIKADSVLSVRPGHRPATLAGHGFLIRQAAGRDWRVSAGTFWQGHPAAADVLAAAVLDALRPQPGDVALDLYCGAGLFAGVLAEAVGPSGRVIAIESGAGAVRDARRNLRATPWARVHRGDVAVLLGEHGLSGAGLAVLDPPRTGLARPVIDALSAPQQPGRPVTDARPARQQPGRPARDALSDPLDPSRPAAAAAAGLRRIAYVSCEPATLARDIALFSGSGWHLEALRAFDAFPMTHHVECLAVLTRNSPGGEFIS